MIIAEGKTKDGEKMAWTLSDIIEFIPPSPAAGIRFVNLSVVAANAPEMYYISFQEDSLREFIDDLTSALERMQQ